MMLQAEIKQTRPFSSLQEEVLLNLLRTSAVLNHLLEHRLRPLGLSGTQYNVLRILRGAGAAGLCQYEIGDRLVAQVPDVPRILERMEKAGWVRRVRAEQDRRMVLASLTASGLKLVDDLDAPMQEAMQRTFASLSEAQLKQLNHLLEAARGAEPPAGEE